MRLPNFPIFESYDELLQHARALLEAHFDGLTDAIENDSTNYNGFVRGDLADAFFPDKMTYQQAVDIVKTDPDISTTEVLDPPDNLEGFIFAAIEETGIQALHKDFEPRARAIFEAAEERRRASEAPTV